jgi:hypothetical protein
MERRTPAELVASNVAKAITDAGTTADIVAQAADIPSATLQDRLAGRSEFTYGELSDVGGFLRLPTEAFLEGVTA